MSFNLSKKFKFESSYEMKCVIIKYFERNLLFVVVIPTQKFSLTYREYFVYTKK